MVALTIKLVTTANRVRQFYQSNADSARIELERITSGASVFSRSSLIIASDLQTEICSPRKIAVIEFQTELAVPFLHAEHGRIVIAEIDPEQDGYSIDADDSEQGSYRADFYFSGGYVLNTRISGRYRDNSVSNQLRITAQIFEIPIIFYLPITGGIGLINPQALTRVVITPGDAMLIPADAIKVDDY